MTLRSIVKPDMNEISANFRSACAVSTALDIIGDKWSLLIVRDMCLNKHRYGDFHSSPEGIPTNILANRLRRLEESGILTKQMYREKPLRYEYYLTEKGADLLPIIQQLALWAGKYVPECGSPPEHFLTSKPVDLLRKP